MGRQVTKEEIEYILANYQRLGPQGIAAMLGKKPKSVTEYVRRIRDRMRKAGDPRWSRLVLNLTIDGDIIRDYGVAHRPDTHGPKDDDPRPIPMVITSHRYGVSVAEHRRNG